MPCMQTLESALNMCCGNYQGLVNQFQEASAYPYLCSVSIFISSTATSAHQVSA